MTSLTQEPIKWYQIKSLACSFDKVCDHCSVQIGKHGKERSASMYQHTHEVKQVGFYIAHLNIITTDKNCFDRPMPHHARDRRSHQEDSCQRQEDRRNRQYEGGVVHHRRRLFGTRGSLDQPSRRSLDRPRGSSITEEVSQSTFHHWKDVVELGKGLVRIGPGSEDGWQSVEEAGEDQSPLPHWGRMMNSYR